MSSPVTFISQHKRIEIEVALKDLEKIKNRLAGFQVDKSIPLDGKTPKTLARIQKILGPLHNSTIDSSIEAARKNYEYLNPLPPALPTVEKSRSFGESSQTLNVSVVASSASLALPSSSCSSTTISAIPVRAFPEMGLSLMSFGNVSSQAASSSSYSAASSSSSSKPLSSVTTAKGQELSLKTLDVFPPSSVLPSHVTSVFSKLLSSGNPNRLSVDEITLMYSFFCDRFSTISKPTVFDKKVTKLARTIILSPKEEGFVCLDVREEGDELIGEGGLKKIYHAAGLHDGKNYALGKCNIETAAKTTSVDPSMIRKRIEREKKLSLSLEGLPRIVRTYLRADDSETFYSFMDFYSGRDLFCLIKDLTLKKIEIRMCDRLAILLGILMGVIGLHTKEILHCDIKPENVFLDEEGYPAIGDFDFAMPIGAPVWDQKKIGTLPYLAPEMIRGEEASKKTDIWACGMIFYMLITLTPLPWQNQSLDKIAENIPHDFDWKPPFFTEDKELSASQNTALRELISDMLNVNPATRIEGPTAMARLDQIMEELYAQERASQQKAEPVKC